MDDAEAFELIDAHLDRQPLTDEQSDALSAWIKANPQRADEAFYRIFLHSYLRVRLQAGLPGPAPPAGDARALGIGDSGVSDPAGTAPPIELPAWARASAFESQGAAPSAGGPPGPRRPFWRSGRFFALTLAVLIGVAGLLWRNVNAWWRFVSHADELYAYEGFDYPGTPLADADAADFKWPTKGGLQGLAGGTGWSEPWQETNSKVAIIVNYDEKEMHWEANDMRKFGPLGYSDVLGNILKSTGHQMRTATSPRSITTREFDPQSFPRAMRDEEGLGRDGSTVWFSFLAQSSLSTAERNRYSYLVIGSKTVAGFRIGKLGAAPTGNWTAVGLLTGAEVNLRSSMFPSGEMVLLVTRLRFRPGPEDATVWINPKLDTEPLETEAALRLQVPDFRFNGMAIHANHSTDFDEIRFGSSFYAVVPREE